MCTLAAMLVQSPIGMMCVKLAEPINLHGKAAGFSHSRGLNRNPLAEFASSISVCKAMGLMGRLMRGLGRYPKTTLGFTNICVES